MLLKDLEGKMPRRPLIITLIALCYFLSPAVIVIQGSIMHHIPLWGQHSIFTRLFFTDIIILFVYPVGGFVIYAVKKWGWYIFLGCSLILISYNIVVYFLNPRYNLFILLLLNITLAIVAGIFFRKHIIAPYFNPRLRWWETEARYKIEINADIIVEHKKLSGDILDISNTGYLIALDHDITPGKIYKVHIKYMHHYVDVHGKVMRMTSSDEEKNRYGVMFVKLTSMGKKGIKVIIDDLEKGRLRDYSRDYKEDSEDAIKKMLYPRLKETTSRYKLNHTAILIEGEKNIQCQMLDISRNGCLIKTEHDISEGTIHKINIRCMKLEAEIEGTIKRKTDLGGLNGYGVEFINITKPEKQKIGRIINTLKRIGARNRLDGARRVSEDVIDKSVAGTPYKIILFFKRLLLKDVKC